MITVMGALEVIWPFVRKFWKFLTIVGLGLALVIQNKCHNTEISRLNDAHDKAKAKIELQLTVAQENYEEEKAASEAMVKAVQDIADKLVAAREEGDRLRALADAIRASTHEEKAELKTELNKLRSMIEHEYPEQDRCEAYVPAAVNRLRELLEGIPR